MGLKFIFETKYCTNVIFSIYYFNRWCNKYRRWRGLPYWSLSKHAKQKVKNAVEFICGFEEIVAKEAIARGVDGVIAGHIHTAEMREIEGVDYYNDGDWVEGCTALVEHHDGRMELIQHAMTRPQPAALPAPLSAPAALEAQPGEFPQNTYLPLAQRAQLTHRVRPETGQTASI
jgi:hypothetical protein